MTIELARLIADNIIDDMCGRQGGDHWFESCDEEIQKEIRDEWTQIIFKFASLKTPQQSTPKKEAQGKRGVR